MINKIFFLSEKKNMPSNQPKFFFINTLVFINLAILFLCMISNEALAIDQINQPESDSTSIMAEEDDFDDDFDFDDEFDSSVINVPDPLSGYNRLMTKINDKLYSWIITPGARAYSFVVPEPGRLAISRSFKNIFFPVRLVNNLLQIKIKRSGVESLRFLINSTIGILGFMDPARDWLELEAYPEDFGQTLGHYGIGAGFHLVLPILGPSNLRDTIGLAPDYFLNPIHYIDSQTLEIGLESYQKLNSSSLYIGEYEALKQDSLDFYILLRDSYEQNRKMKIRD